MERFFGLVTVLALVVACSSSKNGSADADGMPLPDEGSDSVLPDRDTVVAADDLVDGAEEDEDAVSGEDTAVSEEDTIPDADSVAPCTGVWTDPTTGLMWQNCPALTQGNWQSAIAYCEALEHAGYTDWRLPSLSELRSLIRGCPDTVTGGACNATDECLGETPEENCLNHPCAVPDCDMGGGPANGCYRDAALVGECDYHWSSSESATYSDSAWYVDFFGAIISPTEKGWTELYARCVRDGEASDADTLPADEDVTLSDDDTVVHTLTITEPANNSSHSAGTPVHFAGTTTCFPSTVSFVADGQWSLGSVETTNGAFAHEYTFNTPGPSRVITATATGNGCTASGSVTIAITAATPDNPLDVPYFCQYENTLDPASSCQNTSVAMVLKYYGWNGTPDTITAEWGKDYAQSPSGLAEVFNDYASKAALGVSLTPHTDGSFAGLKALLDAGKPVIVHGYFTQYGHVVVTVGYDATGYFVNDPAGQWSEVYQGGYSKYCDYGYSGKAVHYGKTAFEQAIGPDGTIWYHEITP